MLATGVRAEKRRDTFARLAQSRLRRNHRCRAHIASCPKKRSRHAQQRWWNLAERESCAPRHRDLSRFTSTDASRTRCQNHHGGFRGFNSSRNHVSISGRRLALDHGSLQVDTARGLKVLVGCITVDPVTSDRTQFDVTDVDGKVKVSALRHDARIHLHGKAQEAKQGGKSSDTIVREGEQLTRSEHCGGALLRPSDGLDANGGWLDSLGAKITGGAIIVGITCYALCRPNPGPVSPSQP